MILMEPERNLTPTAELKTRATTKWITEMSLTLISRHPESQILWNQLILLEMRLTTWKNVKLAELREVKLMFYHRLEKTLFFKRHLCKLRTFLDVQLVLKIMEVSILEIEEDLRIPI